MGAAHTHRTVVEVLVTDAAARSASFGDLLAHLPGVPPEDVANALRRLAALSLVDARTAARLAPGTRHPARGAEVGEASILPPPHPLDYDWRFTPGTARQLRDWCAQLTRPGDAVALLGTPTVLAAATEVPQGRRWVLLEASPATTAALRRAGASEVIRCDLARGDVPALGARAVVADPPWYPEHTRVFLWAAAQLTRLGAAVLLAQPPVATRPGILPERAALLDFAQQAGLEPEEIHPGALAYLSPPFERRALEARGLAGAVPPDWRKGDLIVLRRTDSSTAARPSLTGADEWTEVMLAEARIRFRTSRQAPDGPADPRVRRLIDGDILASVSRRDPLRAHVSVWTGSNRVFGCSHPGLLATVAQAMAQGGSIDSAVERHLGRCVSGEEKEHIRQAARQLTRLARAETESTSVRRVPAGSIGGARGFPAGGNVEPREDDPAAARSAS